MAMKKRIDNIIMAIVLMYAVLIMASIYMLFWVVS